MTHDVFLSDEEVFVLTGYKQPAKQCAQLKSQGIPFHTNKAGHPRVARARIEGGKATEKTQPKTWSPSWAGNPA